MGTEAHGVGQHGPVPHRGGPVAAQPVAQHRQAERAGPRLGQHAERGQQAQHPVQGPLIGLGGLGQFRRGPLACRQQVRDAKLGGQVDRAGDVQAPDHLQERGGCGPFLLGRPGRGAHQRSARDRTGAREGPPPGVIATPTGPGSASAPSGPAPAAGPFGPAPFIAAAGCSWRPRPALPDAGPAVTTATWPHLGQAPAPPSKEYKQPQKHATSAIIGTFLPHQPGQAPCPAGHVRAPRPPPVRRGRHVSRYTLPARPRASAGQGATPPGPDP